MGKQGLNKKFKSNKDYLIDLILFIIGLIFFAEQLYWSLNHSEEEIMKTLYREDTTGNPAVRFILYKFGKQGLLYLLSTIFLGLSYFFCKHIFEYRRFIIKTKLFKQGLVKDMYDTERITVIQFIKNIFKKKTNCNHSEKNIQKEQEKNK